MKQKKRNNVEDVLGVRAFRIVKNNIIFSAIILGLVLIAVIITSILSLDIYLFITVADILIFASPLSAVYLTISIVHYVELYRSRHSIEIENSYNLGTPSHCYNYSLLSKVVHKAIKKHHFKKGNYIVAFTVSKSSTMRNSSIKQVNSLVSDYLYKYLGNNKKFKSLDFVYCFYHGNFIIYTYASLVDLKEIMSDIESKVFEITKEHDIKAYVQPYFGIEEIRPELSLAELMDNALVARGAGEKRFENITFYTADLRKDASIKEIDDIKKAIANNELVVYYQPKFHLESKKFISSEALVRWNSPEYGLLSPNKFINKAEISGLIHEIDMAVLKQVCQDLATSRKKGERLLPVSINFSLYEFYSPAFLNELFDIIHKTGVSTDLIEIEITETTTQANPFMAISIIKKLRERGFRILMDDFGLGFSNLGNLNRLPFDAVKIDKSFIDGLISDNKSREIVKFLVSLCHTNKMEVIAEGVDKSEEISILKRCGCDTIQGYYYSKPLPRDEYQKLLASNPFEAKEESK